MNAPADHLTDAETDVVLALNGFVVLNETPASHAAPDDPLRPAYQRLPDYVRKMLEKPLRNIRSTHPEAVTMLRQRLSILSQTPHPHTPGGWREGFQPDKRDPKPARSIPQNAKKARLGKSENRPL